MKSTIVIYHGNCADGFGAAWAVWKALGTDNIDYYPGVYGETPPDVDGKEVIMVDFSYKRDVICEMANKSEKILILDHHKSAEAELVDLPKNVTVEFDMERSGAVMAWNWFHSDPAPKLLQHVQNRDLWKFELAFTREIQAAVFSYPYDFYTWNMLARTFDKHGNTRLIDEGMAIERKHHKDVAELVDVCRRPMTIGGHSVPVCSLPYTMASDAGSKMCEESLNNPHPDLLNGGVWVDQFAACYWDTDKHRVFSLRSRGEFDVSEIAQQYGGGGHKNAAGFRVPRDHELAKA